MHARRGCRPSLRRRPRGPDRRARDAAAASRGRSIPSRTSRLTTSMRPWYGARPSTIVAQRPSIRGEHRGRRGCPRRGAQWRSHPRSPSYGTTVQTGPNASTVMHRLARCAARGSTAATAARTRPSRHRRLRVRPRSGSPLTSSASRRKLATCAQALRGAARATASGPMRTFSQPRIADDDLCRAAPAMPRPRRPLRWQARWPCGSPCTSGRPSPVISRTTSRTKRSNSGVPGAASGPSMQELSESVSAVKRTEFAIDVGMPAQLLRRARRARERHGVLAVQVIEQIAEAAADQLQRAFRQDAGLDDAPDDQLREIGRRGRGLDDRGHAGEQRRRQLLEHAPHREVERVDVHGRAFERHADVLADERAGLRQHLDVAVDVDAAVRQLARALARIDEQRAEAAVDVDPSNRSWSRRWRTTARRTRPCARSGTSPGS